MINLIFLHTIIYLIILCYVTTKTCIIKNRIHLGNFNKLAIVRLKVFLITVFFYKTVYIFINNESDFFSYPNDDIRAIYLTLIPFLILFLSLLIYCIAKIIAIKAVGWAVEDVRLFPISLRIKYPDKNSNKRVIKFKYSSKLCGNIAAVSCHPKTIKNFTKLKILIINLTGSITLLLIGISLLMFHNFVFLDNKNYKLLAIYFIILGIVKLTPSKLHFSDGNALTQLLNDNKYEKYKDKCLYDWYQYYPRTMITSSDFKYLHSYFTNKPSKLGKFTAEYLLADTSIRANKEKFEMYFNDCKITSITLTYRNLTKLEANRLFNVKNNLVKLETEYEDIYDEILLENLSNLPPIEVYSYYRKH